MDFRLCKGNPHPQNNRAVLGAKTRGIWIQVDLRDILDLQKNRLTNQTNFWQLPWRFCGAKFDAWKKNVVV